MIRSHPRTKLAVVDTNVLLVANKKQEDASPDCIRTCARRLREICQNGHVVVDDRQRIFNEYRNKTLRIKDKGQREAGDEFVLWIITNLWNPARCTQVPLTPTPEDEENFVEFPKAASLKAFDRSDRVFVAVANAHQDRPPILAACDTDYWKCREGFEASGIKIEFLCKADVARLAKQQE